jgi:hypothetical protein
MTTATAATAARSDAIWLHAANYNVAPLNTKLADRVPELKRGLQSGIPAYPDMNRDNFYDIELPNGWAYIHIRDDKHTVYLVAYSQVQEAGLLPAARLTAKS